jgi:hypothetical protein
MTENGTKTLLEGGAFVGEADDVSAMAHNPAGLSQLRGFNFIADGQLLLHDVTFQRLDAPFDPANPPMSNVQPVSNTGGPFFLPMVGVSYGLPVFDRTLTIALGVYGPPSVGHYAFPEPDYTKDTSTGKYTMDPRKYAPQRYTLVENTIFIVYPTLSVSYAFHPRFSFGISLQPVIGSFAFKQAVTSGHRLIRVQAGGDEQPGDADEAVGRGPHLRLDGEREHAVAVRRLHGHRGRAGEARRLDLHRRVGAAQHPHHGEGQPEDRPGRSGHRAQHHGHR